jgi:trans-2,3-dihydro-3-hydroxyanthranilate isomerase
MQRRFTTLDVFTTERFAGNPLAVVSDGGDLDAARMQAIAREFGLPETVFVLPPADPAHTARLRIFTPATELPFAGHPTVGTAVLLGLSRDNDNKPQQLMLEEQIGLVRCDVAVKASDLAHARFALPVLPRQLDWNAEGAAIAAALGISPSDINNDWFAPEKWSAGIDMCMVPVKSSAALAGASLDLSRWEAAFGNSGPRAAYVFCAQEGSAAKRFRARMFAPLLGIREDPATGSAAAALAGVLTAHGGLGAGAHSIVIEQGREMGRPSTIGLELQIEGGKLSSASIAGDAVIVTQGTLKA